MEMIEELKPSIRLEKWALMLTFHFHPLDRNLIQLKLLQFDQASIININIKHYNHKPMENHYFFTIRSGDKQHLLQNLLPFYVKHLRVWMKFFFIENRYYKECPKTRVHILNEKITHISFYLCRIVHLVWKFGPLHLYMKDNLGHMCTHTCSTNDQTMIVIFDDILAYFRCY